MSRDFKSWLRRLSVLEWLPLVVGTATAIGLFMSFWFLPDAPSFYERYTVVQTKSLKAQFEALDARMGSFEGQLQALSNIPDDNKIAIQLKGMDAALNDLKTRHGRLEEAILTNPAKAIEVPLLRKDLDNLKDSQQQNLVALQQGVDRVYDLNKWLLGAMAVSIITLAISNVLRGKKTTASEH